MTNKKKRILNKLSGEFEVISIEKNCDEDISIFCEFMKNGQKADFEYVFEGGSRGLGNINYEEQEGEDIYEEIMEWIEENFDCHTKIEYKGKELEGGEMELIK